MSNLYVWDKEVDVYALSLAPCSAATAKYLLDPTIPYVWLRRHRPNRYIEWWETDVALRQMPGILRRVRVRDIEFDIEFPTLEFLALLDEFEDFGLELYQTDRHVPDTLTLNNIPAMRRFRILRANGVRSGFLLPHRDEVADFWTFDRRRMEETIAKPEVQALAIPSG